MLLIDRIGRQPVKTREALEKVFVTSIVTPGTIYTSTPTGGSPDSSRLIQYREDCWPVEGEARKQGALKHIVISDFTLESNEDLQHQVADYIPQEGDTHRLFVLQGSKLVEIKSRKDLAKIDYSKIIPVTTQQINKLLFDSCKISSEQTTILDVAKFRVAYDLLNNTDSWINIDT